jgi:DNA-binding NtrC family response regulator
MTATRTTKTETPKTYIELCDSTRDFLAWMFESITKSAKVDQGKFSYDIRSEDPMEVLRALEWAGNLASLAATAELYAVLLKHLSYHVPTEVVPVSTLLAAWITAYTNMIAETTDTLLSDRWRGGSTSGFSNAVDAARRAAAATFIRQEQSTLNYFRKTADDLLVAASRDAGIQS